MDDKQEAIEEINKVLRQVWPRDVRVPADIITLGVAGLIYDRIAPLRQWRPACIRVLNT